METFLEDYKFLGNNLPIDACDIVLFVRASDMGLGERSVFRVNIFGDARGIPRLSCAELQKLQATIVEAIICNVGMTHVSKQMGSYLLLVACDALVNERSSRRVNCGSRSVKRRI